MSTATAPSSSAGNPARLIPLIVASALFMENLDSTVIATALPAIARSLNEDPLHLSLAISSYLLSLSVFIPVSGWMADRYGARRVFRNAIVVFALGSAACAAAQNIGELVLARVAQGTGAALMAPIFGPPLGGLIVTYASWRWIFLINLPIALLGYALVTRFIRDNAGTVSQPFDLAGWLLLGGSLAGLVLGFENLGKHVLPAEIPPFLIALGGGLLLLYLRHARSDPAPVLRLNLLRLATFRASVSGGSLFRLGVGSFSLLMPMMLQLGFGMSALGSGLTTFASAAGALLMKTQAQKLTRRYGFRRLLLWNTLISGAALIGCGWFSADTPRLFMIGFLLVTGFFRSLEFTCVNTLAFADVEERDMSQATSFSSTAQQVALSMGIGIGSQVLNLSLAARHAASLAPRDFTAAFCAVGLISLSALLSFRRLAPDAGSNVSGHRMAVADLPTRTTHQ